jgi:hypothetical protein
LEKDEGMNQTWKYAFEKWRRKLKTDENSSAFNNRRLRSNVPSKERVSLKTCVEKLKLPSVHGHVHVLQPVPLARLASDFSPKTHVYAYDESPKVDMYVSLLDSLAPKYGKKPSITAISR